MSRYAKASGDKAARDNMPAGLCFEKAAEDQPVTDNGAFF